MFSCNFTSAPSEILILPERLLEATPFLLPLPVKPKLPLDFLTFLLSVMMHPV